MTSALIFALSIAGFGLLAFGERMGLGTQLASAGVAGIFVLAATALALGNMTSRLNRFMVGPERGSGLGFAALIVVALVFGLRIGLPGSEPTHSPASILAFLAGFVAAFVLVPLNPWRGFEGKSATSGRPERSEIERGAGTLGALPVLSVATLALSALLLVRYFPIALDEIAEATGWSRKALFAFALASVMAMALFGGLQALARAALVLILVAFTTAALPFFLLLMGEILARAGPEMVSRISESAATIGAHVPEPGALKAQWPASALGFALGLAVHQPAAPIRTPMRRAAAITGGMGVALGFVLLAGIGESQVQDITANRIVAAPPSQWPVFVFDETIRGWFSVCGAIPEDAQAAARHCATNHPRNLLLGTAFRFEPGLALPALALAQGWPIILGFIWALLVPFLGLVALAFLLHAAASGFAEQILFRLLHPRALRSWRLAIARLTLIAMAAALFLMEGYGWRLDPVLFRWALLSLVGTALAASLAYGMIAAMRAYRSRRVSRA